MHKRSKQFLWKSIIFLFGSLLLFFILRFFHLPTSLQFGSDEGRDFLTTWHIFTTKQLTLIGPPSEFTIHGRQFFFGPASYLVILLPLILGKGDPLVVSCFLIFLNATMLVITLAVLFRYLREKLVVYCFDVFCVCTPALVAYSQSYWNPYLMFPTAMLLLALLVKQTRKEITSRKKLVKKPALIDTFFIGFLSGLGLQFHYSFIFAIITSLIWLWVGKGLRWKSFLFWLGGIVLGFSPIILFELKSHFYNTQTLLMVLSSSNFHNSFQFHAF